MNIKPDFRFRRLRKSAALRSLVRENHLHAEDFILPIFIEETLTEKLEVSSMPGVYRYPEADLPEVVNAAYSAGIRAVILFGVSHCKDESGLDTLETEGLMARMIRSAKQTCPEMVVITDNCFCEYTTHGHCGVLDATGEDVDNDLTLKNLAKQAAVAAQAGADMIAPSGMMDGMISAIREGLDEEGFTHIPVMSYSTKFASAFYGPFRDAVDSAFKGTRATYQMDPANAREALAESMQDDLEGADILMVKPALAYLDVVKTISENTHKPVAVYHVSGEYAMVKAAANAGVIDEKSIVLETLLSFKRAGASLIITYYALDAVNWLSE